MAYRKEDRFDVHQLANDPYLLPHMRRSNSSGNLHMAGLTVSPTPPSSSIITYWLLQDWHDTFELLPDAHLSFESIWVFIVFFFTQDVVKDCLWIEILHIVICMRVDHGQWLNVHFSLHLEQWRTAACCTETGIPCYNRRKMGLFVYLREHCK